MIATPIILYFLGDGWQSWVNESWAVLTSGSETRIRAWLDPLGGWGPLLVIVLMTIQMFLVVIPSWLLMVVAVLAYGGWGGGSTAFVAILVAGSVGYGVGKWIGEGTLVRWLGEKKDRRLRQETDCYGFWAIVITRLNPLFSNDAISIVAGALRLGFWKFLSATTAGILPLLIFIGILGQEASAMKTGLMWLSIISLLGLGIKIAWDKHQDQQETAPEERSEYQ